MINTKNTSLFSFVNLLVFSLWFVFTSTAQAAVGFRAASNNAINTITPVGSITHVATGAPRSRSSCGNITPSIPAGVNNDLLIALVIAKEDDGNNISTPNNWNTYYSAEYPGNPGNNNEMNMRIFWRIADGTEGASVTINQSGTCNSFGAQISRFRGVDTVSPFETASAGVITQDSGNLDTGSITTTSSTAMLLVAGFVSDNRSTSQPSSWNQSFDYIYNNNGAKPDFAITLNYQLQTSAGPKSISNWDLSGGGGDENAGLILALTPSGGSGGLSINVPAGTTANDVMIASISARPNTLTVTRPTGWTLIRQISQGAGNSSSLSTYYRVATGSEPPSYTWLLSSAGFTGAAGGIATFTGVDASPIDAEAGTTTPGGISHVAPSVTTTLADGMLVTIHEFTSSRNWTAPPGMTEVVDISSETPNNAVGISIEMNYEARPTAGATGTRTASIGGNADTGATQSISLKPKQPLICWTDDFNRANGSPGSDWLVSNNSGGFGNPVIFNNRLRLTDASGNVATMATLQRLFPGAGNRIEIEFDQIADYGSGADGIALTLSDSSITPAPGGYGGSLGYAQRSGINGFAGGWLGIGIDEYGNFSNPTEGRQGGPGFRRDSISIRGSGSGTTGYIYHAGTAANLNPEVDNNGGASPLHRYRIIVDHTNSVNAWVSLERDTGSGYAMLVAAYDAKAPALNQATVPTNWMLSYTGSTGGSTNVHEIDNLRICAVSQSSLTGADHYSINHSGTGVNCNSEQITITAQDASHAAVDAGTKTITLTTATSRGTWSRVVTGTGTLTDATAGDGAATYTFPGGESSVVLAFNYTNPIADPDTFSFNVTDGATTEASGSAITANDDPNISFYNSGFIFNNETDSNTTIPTQLSGKNSNTGYNNKTITLQAVRTSTSDPSQCLPAFQNTTLNIDFAAECRNPANCVAGQQLILNGAALTTNNDNAGTGSSGYDTRSVTFDGNGKLNLIFNYPEAGQIQLHTRHNILLDDGSNTPSGNFMYGSSNDFVVRPLGFSIDFSGQRTADYADDGILNNSTGSNLSYAANASGSLFTQAGQNFVSTLTAVTWQAADDSNNDGIPDTGANLTNNATTQNFGNESPAITPTNVAATHTTPLPNFGVLANSANSAAFNNGVGTKMLAWSEVGILNLTTTLNNYLLSGDNVAGNAQNVGRFAPDHFDTTLIEGCAVSNNYTYSGQPFSVSAYAKNTAGTTTLNYANTYAFNTAVSNAGATANFTNNVILPVSFANGIGTRTNVIYTFTVKETIPAAITLRARDADTPTATGITEGTTQIRSGRMRLENVFGSELTPLTMPLSAEYYSDSGTPADLTDDGFILNPDDSCSGYDATVGALTNYTDNLSPGDVTVAGTGTVAAGVANITFSAPGAGNEGSVNLLLNTTSSPNWLTYNWNVDCDNADADDNLTTGIDTGLCGPFGKASFGLYRGDDRIIYWREVF